jgi:hypothetical protein
MKPCREHKIVGCPCEGRRDPMDYTKAAAR